MEQSSSSVWYTDGIVPDGLPALQSVYEILPLWVDSDTSRLRMQTLTVL